MNYGKLCIFVIIFIGIVSTEMSKFRILAPEIVCPKDENSVIDKPDNTIITLQTEDTHLKFDWTVRWVPLDSPTQWFTLMLWRSVKMLEKQLNGPQPEPFIYLINNTDLLKGVDYVFNVTSIEIPPLNGTTKSFHIDNIKGDQKLIVDGRSDKFSVFLVGGEEIYTDMEYVLEAEVTTCSTSNDYYFVWKVESDTGEYVNVSHIKGWRLTIPPYTLKAGSYYYVYCQIYKNSSYLVTQTDLPFQVLYRELKVYMNVDILRVSINSEFVLQTYVDNRDYYNEEPTFSWSCTYNGDECKEFESMNYGTLEVSNGLTDEGEYIISVEVNIRNQQAFANVTVYVLQATLPVIHIYPLPHVINDQSSITLVANVTNVAPTCTLTWYFASEQYLEMHNNETCDEECQYGEALSDTVTVYSLEENFLNELSDYTNETEWRHVSVNVTARRGRARFVAECGCSLTFNCETKGLVYGDVYIIVNKPPVVGELKIAPDHGTAMETIFHITKPTASDPDKPLLYTLLCSVGESDALVLASNLQHLAVDIFLPFVGPDGTQLWMDVCDSFGACSSSGIKTVKVGPGEGRTVDLLLQTMKGFIQRCEMMLLRRVVESTITTYINAKQSEPLAIFTKELSLNLPSINVDHCLKTNEDYHALLNWLALRGVDVSPLTD